MQKRFVVRRRIVSGDEYPWAHVYDRTEGPPEHMRSRHATKEAAAAAWKAGEDRWAGMYVKVGGGLTEDVQEAEIIGWTKSSHKRWDRPEYELVPVIIATFGSDPHVHQA